MSVERIVGIDFGTSTSVIRVKRYKDGVPVSEGKLDVIPVKFNVSDDVAPTVIQRLNGDTYYGPDALVKKRGEEVFRNFKTDLESKDSERRKQARAFTKEYFTYLYEKYCDNDNGIDLGAPTDVVKTLVSYPVKWKPETREFMLECAKEAGFKNVVGVDEAEAAVHAALLRSERVMKQKGYLTDGVPINIMLVDMGAGTTDIIICSYTPGKNPNYKTLITWPKSGETFFGGHEVDDVLRDYISDFVPEDIRNKVMNKFDSLKFKAWKESLVSKALAQKRTVNQFADLQDYVYDLNYCEVEKLFSFGRAEFEGFAAKYLADYPKLISDCISASGLDNSKIDLVVLTGGHSMWYFADEMLSDTRYVNLPKIREDKERIIRLDRPQETVANGLVYSPIAATFVNSSVSDEPETGDIRNYKGICLKKKSNVVTDEMIQREIDNLLYEHAELIPDDNGIVEPDDTVLVSGEMIVAGETMKFENEQMDLHESRLSAGFREGMLGHKVGDEFQIESTSTSDFGDQFSKIRDKITLNKIFKKKLPTFGDSFVKRVTDSETVEEYTQRLKTKLQAQLDRSVREDLSVQMIDCLSELLIGTPSESAVEAELEFILDYIRADYRNQGKDFDAFIESGPVTYYDLRKRHRPQAVKRARYSMALWLIINKEQITVNRNELPAYRKKYAEDARISMEECLKISDDNLVGVAKELKCVEFIIDHAQIVDAETGAILQHGDASERSGSDSVPEGYRTNGCTDKPRMQPCVNNTNPVTNDGDIVEYYRKNAHSKIAVSNITQAAVTSCGTVVVERGDRYRPADIKDWKDIVAVACGHDYTVGIKSDGTVVATGANNYGQCNVRDWRDIVAVACGGHDYTVGIKSDGTVVATGANAYGLCNVGGWKDIVAVACGGYHTVGLKSDGTVVAKGANDFGQRNVQDWRDIVAVACGYNYTVGLKDDGTVVATGSNLHGQCSVQGWRNIISVCCGAEQTVGIKNDGTVVVTGDRCNVEGWRDIVSVACGDSHVVGLRKDGTVVATGSNLFGQCNLNHWRDIIAVFANKKRTYGLKKDGTVICTDYKGFFTNEIITLYEPKTLFKLFDVNKNDVHSEDWD